MALARLSCRIKGCTNFADQGEYCQVHFVSESQRKHNETKRKLTLAFSQKYTPEEAAELTGLPISDVYSYWEDIKSSCDAWLQATSKDRVEAIVDELKKGHDTRINELYTVFHSAGDQKVKVSALAQIQKEEEHFVKQMQSLGWLPKISEKLEVKQTSIERELFAMEAEGRVVDNDVSVTPFASNRLNSLIKKATGLQVD